MRRRRWCMRPWSAILVAVLWLHGVGADAWAQRPARLPNQDAGYLQWGVALGLAAVICLSAFLSPKRSHLN